MNTDKINNKIDAVTAMLCITMLECAALLQGINGVMLTGVIGILAGLGGYKFGVLKNDKNGE